MSQHTDLPAGMKAKAQAIVWSDNSYEEKEAMVLDLLHTQEKQIREELREKVKAMRKEWIDPNVSKEENELWKTGYFEGLDDVLSLLSSKKEEET